MATETNAYLASLLRKRAHVTEPGKLAEIDAALRANGIDPDAKEKPKVTEPVPERHAPKHETTDAPTLRRGRGRH